MQHVGQPIKLCIKFSPVERHPTGHFIILILAHEAISELIFLAFVLTIFLFLILFCLCWLFTKRR